MNLILKPAEIAPDSAASDLYGDIIAAADLAYDTIAARGMDREGVCKLPVCSEASAIIVKNLIDCGYDVRQEVVTSAELGQHSYSIITKDDEELIADSAWQQFLPEEKANSRHLPQVLIGTRREIMKMARSFGVGESVLHVWEAGIPSMSLEKARLNDQAAEDAAEEAADNGAWDRFMAA